MTDSALGVIYYITMFGIFCDLEYDLAILVTGQAHRHDLRSMAQG